MSQLSGKIDLLLFDFDGVLTDNRVLVMQDGQEAVFCNRADGLAFDAFRASGLPVMIVSTETNPVVTARGQKLKVPVLQGIGDKSRAVADYCEQHRIALERVMFVGNDINDIPAMRIVGYPVAVADAHPKIKAMATHVLSTRGGDGVAREIADLILPSTASDQ